MEDDQTNQPAAILRSARIQNLSSLLFFPAVAGALYIQVAQAGRLFFYAVLPALFLGPWLVLVGGGTLLHPPCSGVGPLRKAVAHGRLRMDTFHFTRSRLGLSDDEMGRRS